MERGFAPESLKSFRMFLGVTNRVCCDAIHAFQPIQSRTAPNTNARPSAEFRRILWPGRGHVILGAERGGGHGRPDRSRAGTAPSRHPQAAARRRRPEKWCQPPIDENPAAPVDRGLDSADVTGSATMRHRTPSGTEPRRKGRKMNGCPSRNSTLVARPRPPFVFLAARSAPSGSFAARAAGRNRRNAPPPTVAP